MKFVFDERLVDSPFVEKIWRSTSEGGGSFISTSDYHWEMVITKQRGKTTFTVRGPETKANLAPVPVDAEFMGIVFKLGTFMPHLPVKALVDNDLNLPETTSQTFYLHGSAWQIPNFENVDGFINRMVRDGLLDHDPIVESALNGHLTSEEISLRSVQRRFLHATGLTQKTIQQIERAQQAVALLKQGVPILDTVFETGYFDQAHLSKSIKHYFGQTPTELIQQVQWQPE